MAKCTRCRQTLDLVNAWTVEITVLTGEGVAERVTLAGLHRACGRLKANARVNRLRRIYCRKDHTRPIQIFMQFRARDLADDLPPAAGAVLAAEHPRPAAGENDGTSSGDL